jgi:two-component system, response regulator YesN
MTLTHNDLNIVAQVIAILNKEYMHRQSHSRLANRFYICDRKLRNIFKRVTGKTINDFLTTVRIEKAKELLCITDDPIKKIATEVGYDTRNLEKQFKNFTEMTPLDWRNNNRQVE